MSLKQFKIARLITVIVLAFIVSCSVTFGNYVIPVIALALAIIVSYALRKRVKEVIADERDYQIGGKAAAMAIQVFSWVAIVVTLVFYSQKDANPVFEPLILTLSFSVCFLLILYSVLFKYFYKK